MKILNAMRRNEKLSTRTILICMRVLYDIAIFEKKQ